MVFHLFYVFTVMCLICFVLFLSWVSSWLEIFPFPSSGLALFTTLSYLLLPMEKIISKPFFILVPIFIIYTVAYLLSMLNTCCQVDQFFFKKYLLIRCKSMLTLFTILICTWKHCQLSPVAKWLKSSFFLSNDYTISRRCLIWENSSSGLILMRYIQCYLLICRILSKFKCWWMCQYIHCFPHKWWECFFSFL